ncbi:E3 ubiquitin protein ligase RIE1-like isoform X1 [Papaver somniferum]|uniref:E3 ubiquitin protein ligase RIE1-like isoform X1 n=1 Tax=Papaver somniferum TaxID=3469 RepID=UPI000E6F8086|nr:E3 ubiquitin protein ligase RIE1-like isoform X1 [Papaver somniferum]
MEDEDPSTERRGLGLDPTPLLHQLIRSSRRTNNPTTPSTPSYNRSRFSLLFSRATNRSRIISEPSSMFRRDSTSSVGLDGQQNDNWGYSKPVVILDVIWNLAFVLVSSVVLSSTISENPSTPLRVWIVGYAIQCLFHVGFVYFEYQRRISIVIGGDDGENQGNQLFLSSENRSRRYKWMESMNTLVSFFWWVIGFYWIVAGGQALLLDAPRLYWLAVVFLAFDVFFAIFCIALACIIGVALCCCLPCIVAILYTVAVQEGASEDDINVLPKHKFRQMNQHEKSNADNRQEVVPVAVMEQSTCNITSELALPPEDSECCICLSQYVDGVELHSLPCNHHFHSGCIVKWLRINATCPLCKFNILHGDELV